MILVTGGAGFIGSKLAQKLLDNGEEVAIIDNLSTGYLSNIPQGAVFIQGDVFDTAVYGKLSDLPITGIFHIAGQASGELSFEDPAYDLKTNTLSTLLILQFAKMKGISRLVYTSSMSVYGDKDEAATEVSATNPKSFYAVGKLASEQYLKIYSQFGIKSTSLRLFNVYGPGQNMENLKQGMVSIFLAQALANKKIQVKGSGDRFRDFIFIDDVIEALLLSYYKTGQDYACYNICTGRKTTINTLLEIIQSELPFAISVYFEGSTPGDQHGLFGNNSLFASGFGFVPKVSLEEGIKQTIKKLLIKQ